MNSLQMAYEAGVKLAMQEAGLVKEAADPGKIRRALALALNKSPRGLGALTALGGGTGALTGALASEEGERASGALKGLGIGAAAGAGGAYLGAGLGQKLRSITDRLPNERFEKLYPLLLGGGVGISAAQLAAPPLAAYAATKK